MKTHPLLKIINNSIVELPTPWTISYMWNFGSLLGLCLMLQILTGLFLATHYTADANLSFDILSKVKANANYNALLLSTHAMGATLFFMCLFFHVARGIYYKSYTFIKTWTVGMMIMIIMMFTAFVGYVLPWGQMSFWGATVITNLLSIIPYLGPTLVQWLWGGFTVNNYTLIRFFTLHFTLPFLIVAMVMLHLMYLHQTGSNNPLGITGNKHKTAFHPYFTVKDLFGMIFIMTAFMIMTLSFPYLLMDPENYILANPMIAPLHIQPEWYFLFAYAILRSIPNKLGGVLAMILSILLLALLPYFGSTSKTTPYNPMNKIMFWTFIFTFIMLTWIGSKTVEMPYLKIGQILTTFYFTYFLFMPLSNMYKKLNL